jgi:MinD-like ATPase involved in chromosome partitioning or flagellar assembly
VLRDTTHLPTTTGKPPKRAIIIAVANTRPNVGKTTIAVNLAASFVMSNYPCLLLDLAPNAEASWALGVRLASSSHSACAVLDGTASVKALRLPTASGIHLVAGHRSIASFRGPQIAKRFHLRLALQIVLDQYAFIILDCPTRPRAVGAAALSVADRVVIPYGQEDIYALPEDLLSPLQLAHLKGQVGFVASKALDGLTPEQRPEYPHWPSAQFLGKVRFEAGLRRARRSGLPTVLAQPRTAFAHDFITLARALAHNRVEPVED